MTTRTTCLALLVVLAISLSNVQSFQYSRGSPALLSSTRLVNPLRTPSALQAPVARPLSTLFSAEEGSAAVTAPSTPAKKDSKLWNTYLKTMDVLTTMFPVWTVLFAGLALYRPQSFSWFTTKYFTASLGKFLFILKFDYYSWQ